jgi:hypothetical protein
MGATLVDLAKDEPELDDHCDKLKDVDVKSIRGAIGFTRVIIDDLHIKARTNEILASQLPEKVEVIDFAE